MKICPLASFALLSTVSAVSAKKIHSARHRNNFVKAMRTSHENPSRSASIPKDQTPSLKTFSDAMSGDSKRARKLRKKVLQKAKFVSGRDLQNNNNYNANANNAYGNNNNANANANANSGNSDGADDYFMAYGNWNNAFGFDPTQYSLSYHRCAAVKQFDDEVAAREDTTDVFATKHFAIFRFCPSRTCEGLQENPEDEEYAQYQAEYAAAQNSEAQNEYAEYQQQMYENQPVQYNGQYMTQGDFDRLKFAGANGEGCQNNYGEYMLEMEDYLALMVDYHNERFEMYCETCEDCMYDVYQTWLQQGGQDWTQEYGNRKLKDRTDQSWKEDLESDDFQRALNNAYDPWDICPEYDTCRYYSDSCKNGIDESLTQYFECTEVERNNGQVAYIGPHCAEDGTTITLGVYGDEDCNSYIGNGVNIANFLGYELEGDELFPFITGSLTDIIPEEGITAAKIHWIENYDAELAEYYTPVDQMCIPCMASRQPYQERQQGNQDDDDSDGDDEINELCTNLYMVSARCDKHFRSYSNKSKQAKFAEAMVSEDLTCDFIESIVMGNYDEMGFVNGDNMQKYDPDAKSGFLANSMMWEQYGHVVQEVSPLQIFGLIASIAACILLGLYSVSLKHGLSHNGQAWRPRRFRAGLSKVLEKEAPEHDPITMGRSQSEMTPAEELSARNRSYYNMS